MDNEEQFNEASEFINEFFEDFKKRENFYPTEVNQDALARFQKLSVLAKIFEKQYNDCHDIKIKLEILPPDDISPYGFVSLIRRGHTEAEIDFDPRFFKIINDMKQLSSAVSVYAQLIDEHKDDIEVSIFFTIDNILK